MTTQQQPYQQPQQSYQQPPMQQPYVQPNPTEQPVGVGEWIWSTLLLCVPFVGFIMMLIWAFGGNTKKSKSNYCKAMLIVSLISVIVTVIFYVILFAAGILSASMLDSMYY